MKAIIKIYAKLIKSGEKTIDEVPEKDRLDVETALADLNKISETNETVETNNE
jgi:predicted transcriptional regulator